MASLISPHPSTSATTNNVVDSQIMSDHDKHKSKHLKLARETSETPLGVCMLLRLPLELLAEILISTHCPGDVLSFARTSKHFREMLLSPASVFIWRGARETCIPEPPPVPISMLTEPSYAALLFDKGVCEICKAPTHSFYTSFSLRLWLCSRDDCNRQFLMKLIKPKDSEFDQALGKLLPYLEPGVLNLSGTSLAVGLGWNYSPVYRRPDWERARTRWSGIDPKELLSINGKLIEHTAELVKLSISLQHWKKRYGESYQALKRVNEKFVENLANEHGYVYWDLLNCTPFGALHRHKCKTFQHVTRYDFKQLVPVIDECLLVVNEKRQRRAREASYKKKRREVAQHHNRLQSKDGPTPVLPTLPVFRRLPIISVLQAPDSMPADVTTKLDVTAKLGTTSWIKERLERELKTWSDGAKQSLGAVLGYPNWKTASTVTLHPAERVTARYQCQYCTRVVQRYKDDECFDFLGACLHECHTTKRQKRTDENWDAKRFVRDDKAISAMTQLAILRGADPAREGCREAIDSIGVRIVCQSCSPPMVMGPKSVVGHCHRHDEMKMALIPRSEAQAMLTYHFDFGLAQKLMRKDGFAKTNRALNNYGCRICLAQDKALAANRGLSTARSNQAIQHLKKEAPASTTILERSAGRHSFTFDQEPRVKLNAAQSSPGLGDSRKQTSTSTAALKGLKGPANDKNLAARSKKPFTFDGLRSHLKASHDIKEIRDEDFFCYNSMKWNPESSGKPLSYHIDPKSSWETPLPAYPGWDIL